MDNHKIPEKVLLQAIQRTTAATVARQQSTRPVSEVSDHGGRHGIISRSSSGEEDASGRSSDSSRPESPVNFSRSPVRIFRAQEAVTSSLISTDPNFQAFHDALLIKLFLILLFTIVRDSYQAGSLFLDTTFFRVGCFGGSKDITRFCVFEVSVLTWAFVLHPLFKVWKSLRSITDIPMVSKLVDIVFLCSYVVYLLGGLYLTVYVLVGMDLLPRIATLVAGVEQFRLSMKGYSFIRENAYKVLYPWHKDDTSGPAVWYKGQMSPAVGSFKQYCYFLFAPTLLYRDHYPRTSGIRWHAVFMYSVQMFVSVWCCVFIASNILYPSSLREEDIVRCFMLSLITGLLSLVLCNIAVLHSYTNLSAELTCFADRKFYDTWWTCTSFSSFYRKWNLLVHDWIHSYIYVDFRKIFNKKLAVFTTIFVSSVVHEYLLALGIGFVLPVVTMLFAGIGVFFYVLKPLRNHRLSNLFILLCLSLGMAIIISLLILEYASRQYCPTQDNSWVKPHIIHCYQHHNQPISHTQQQ